MTSDLVDYNSKVLELLTSDPPAMAFDITYQVLDPEGKFEGEFEEASQALLDNCAKTHDRELDTKRKSKSARNQQKNKKRHLREKKDKSQHETEDGIGRP